MKTGHGLRSLIGAGNESGFHPGLCIYVTSLVLFILFFPAQAYCQSQEWQAAYDAAVKQYQSQQYDAALTNAIKADTISNSLDKNKQAYTLQLITVIALDNNDTALGLQYVSREEEMFQATDGPNSKGYGEALHKHAMFLLQASQPIACAEKFENTLAVLKNVKDEPAISYALIEIEYGQLLLDQNDFAKAKPILEHSLEALAQSPDHREEYVNTLFLTASTNQKLNELPAADTQYRKVVSVLEASNATDSPLYKESKRALDAILLSKDNKADASLLSNADNQVRQTLTSGIAFQNSGYPDKAIIEYQKAAHIVTSGPVDKALAFSVYLNLGRAYLQLNKVTEAKAALDNLSPYHSAFPPGGKEVAFAGLLAGDIAAVMGNMPAAIEQYRAAITPGLDVGGAILDGEIANACKRLLTANECGVVIQLLRPLLNRDGKQPLSEKEEVVLVLPYCDAMVQCGEVNSAIEQLGQSSARATSKAIKFRYDLAKAGILKDQGEWSTAMNLLISMTVPENEQELEADYYVQKAKLNQQFGYFAKAEKDYLKSVDLYRTIVPVPQQIGSAINALGILYTQFGNYEQAEKLYDQLLSQPEPFLGFHTTVRQNLAGVYEETMRYEKASTLLEQVIPEDQHRLGTHHPDYAIALQNLAALYEKRNMLQPARELYQEALRIDKENAGDQSLSYATKSANLAVVYVKSGELSTARALFETSLKIRETKLGKDHPDYVFNEYNLAVLLQRMKKPAEALPAFQHVSAFYVKQINELFPAMSEHEKTLFYNKINEVINAYQDFAIENAGQLEGLTDDLLNFRLSTKALLLNSSSKVRSRIMNSGDKALQERFTQWLNTKEELGKFYNMSLEQRTANKNQIESLQGKANESEKWLSTQSELFASQSTDAPRWQTIQSKLRESEAAIEIIRLKLNIQNDSVIYAALILTSTMKRPAIVVFPKGKAMEGIQFHYYRNSIAFQQHDLRSYDNYWRPMEPFLTGVKKIYFSSDGVFNKISPATLYNATSKEYLIDHVSIDLVSNLYEIVSSEATTHHSKSASLFGDVDFTLGFRPTPAMQALKQENPIKSVLKLGVPDLPATRIEIDRIGETLKTNQWSVHSFYKGEASESSIKAVQNTAVLHIATHGFFIPTMPDGQGVVSTASTAFAGQSPLLQSGLLFSGVEKYLYEPAPGDADDGVLTAYEAMNLNLDKTELVVLSACETGAGEIRNGEGVYGLQRAILLAGADNLLMSLWKVDDKATEEMMAEFYSQWNKISNKAEAFRNSQLEIKKKYPFPYFWGGFVMIGSL